MTVPVSGLPESGTLRTEPWAGNRVEPSAATGRLLVLPGANYGVTFPLLHYGCRALADRGWYVHVAHWDLAGVAADWSVRVAFVQTAADRLLASAPEVAAGAPTLVLAKSLGTLAAGWAAERGLPGVWLTPVLAGAPVLSALADHPAPGLVAGGTADPLWDPAAARASGLSVLEIPGADHGLEVRGDWRASLDALRAVLDAVDDLAGRLETHQPTRPD